MTIDRMIGSEVVGYRGLFAFPLRVAGARMEEKFRAVAATPGAPLPVARRDGLGRRRHIGFVPGWMLANVLEDYFCRVGDCSPDGD